MRPHRRKPRSSIWRYTKAWKRMLCNYKRDKYNWGQVLRRANSKQRTVASSCNPNHKPNGIHIVSNNEIALPMGTDYCRIRMQIEIDCIAEIRYLICDRCDYRNPTKVGVEVHLARNRDNLHRRNDLQCPFAQRSTETSGQLIATYIKT